MTRRINCLRSMMVWASDGPIGKVSDVLFDDSRWSVRYLAVLSNRLPGAPTVLVRPHLLQRIEDVEGRVYVPFTRSQAAILPDLDSDMPVSRRQTLARRFALSHVPPWAGGGPWGSLTIPSDLFREIVPPPQGHPADPHLRSFGEVRGYRARGPHGAIGRVRDMIVDEEWLVSDIEIQTRGWAAAHRLMVPARSVTRISWRARAVIVSGPEGPAPGGVVSEPPASLCGSRTPTLFADESSAELSIGSSREDWDGLS